MIKVIIHHDLLFYCNHPINTMFWSNARMRKGLSLLSRTRWRRRAWRLLLERNAGGKVFWKQWKSQVSFYSFFCWNSDCYQIVKMWFCSSETLVFPITVLFAMVAYAGVAIFFYNNDGWFRFVYVQWTLFMIFWIWPSMFLMFLMWNVIIFGIWCSMFSMLSTYNIIEENNVIKSAVVGIPNNILRGKIIALMI